MQKQYRNICECLSCGEILESKHRHDFKMCKCENKTFTDGGLDYIRRGGKNLDLIKDLSHYNREE